MLIVRGPDRCIARHAALRPRSACACDSGFQPGCRVVRLQETPCLRGKNTVLRQVFASSCIYGFLKDLAEFQPEMPHKRFRTLCAVPCIRHVLNDLAEPEGASRCIYGFLKDLAEPSRARLRAQPLIYLILKDLAALNANARARAPRIYGFLKDLVTSNRGFPSKYHTSPRIPRFLKDLAALNHAFWRAHRGFPNKHRTPPCIYGFLKDLFRHWAFLPSAEITVFGGRSANILLVGA